MSNIFVLRVIGRHKKAHGWSKELTGRLKQLRAKRLEPRKSLTPLESQKRLISIQGDD